MKCSRVAKGVLARVISPFFCLPPLFSFYNLDLGVIQFSCFIFKGRREIDSRCKNVEQPSHNSLIEKLHNQKERIVLNRVQMFSKMLIWIWKKLWQKYLWHKPHWEQSGLEGAHSYSKEVCHSDIFLVFMLSLSWFLSIVQLCWWK